MEASLDLSTYLFKLFIWFYKGRNYCLRQYLPFNAYVMVQYELLNVTHDVTYWPFCIGSLDFGKVGSHFSCLRLFMLINCPKNSSAVWVPVYIKDIFSKVTLLTSLSLQIFSTANPVLIWKVIRSFENNRLGIQIFIFYCFLLMK